MTNRLRKASLQLQTVIALSKNKQLLTIKPESKKLLDKKKLILQDLRAPGF